MDRWIWYGSQEQGQGKIKIPSARTPGSCLL
uniref:Uncharacterized protein n=1 Tax=Arundo donax TaxID=35708 RepID=A0A0A9GHV6_ARUDO